MAQEMRGKMSEAWSPSDNALTPEEAYELFREGKLNLKWAPAGITKEDFCKLFLEKSPVTPAAVHLLDEFSLRYHKTLWQQNVTEAKKRGRQVDKATVQEKCEEMQAEKERAEDAQDDDVGSMSCQVPSHNPKLADKKYQPTTNCIVFWNKEGVLQYVTEGMTSKPVRQGNFLVVMADKDIADLAKSLVSEFVENGNDEPWIKYQIFTKATCFHCPDCKIRTQRNHFQSQRGLDRTEQTRLEWRTHESFARKVSAIVDNVLRNAATSDVTQQASNAAAQNRQSRERSRSRGQHYERR